jgi:ABC-type sugar transport system substrate-binding protein
MRQLLREDPDLDPVFATFDMMALGASSAWRQPEGASPAASR